jgi:hypothetical protein
MTKKPNGPETAICIRTYADMIPWVSRRGICTPAVVVLVPLVVRLVRALRPLVRATGQGSGCAPNGG